MIESQWMSADKAYGTPRRVTFTMFFAFVAGTSGLLAQTPNVVAWGVNNFGQRNVPMSLTNAKAIAGGRFHSLALKGDDTVVGWGNNDYGQSTVPPGLANVAAIAGGERHSLALGIDGTVVAWGANNHGQISVPAGLNNVIAIASGTFHNVALKNDGTVVAWGGNFSGQTIVPPGLSGVVAISASGSHTVALKGDGTVVDWGNGSAAPAGLSGIIGVAAGGFHSLALKSDGTVVAWGDNSLNQANVPAGLTGVVAIAGGETHSVALKSDGTVIVWGASEQTAVPSGLLGVSAIASGGFHTLAIKSVASPVTWGDNRFDQANMPAGLTNVTAISAGNYHSLALRSDGTVVAWGYNDWGQLNVPAGLTGVIAVSASGSHSLALKSDGTVVGWGYDGSGQTNPPAGLSGVTAIAGGFEHSLALKSNGTVVGWGYNSFGEVNVPPGLTGVVAIDGGLHHSIALKSDGTVVAWGLGESGQTDVPVGLTGVRAISTSASHNLALRSDGTVVAWGTNDFGESTVPAGLTGVIAISAGNEFSLALKGDGSIVLWGDLTRGQAALPAGLNGVVAITAGGSHVVALRIGPPLAPVTVPVTISSSPSGRSFSVVGAGCEPGSYTAPQTLPWTPGVACTVNFTSPQSGVPGTQYVLTGWEDGPALASRTITAPASAATFTANFKTQYLLSTLVNPAGSGTVSGAGYYDAGSPAAVVATAATGYQFGSWTGPVAAPASATTTVIMDAPVSVTANFRLTTTTTATNRTGVYSDMILLSASVEPLDATFSGSLQFQVGGTNVGAPLPVSRGGIFLTQYIVDKPAGAHVITAILTSTDPSVAASTGTSTLTVSLEDATLAASSSNPQSVEVSTPGGVANSITLRGTFQQAQDGRLGNLSLGAVTVSLVPSQPASATVVCPVTNNNGQLTAACVNVPVEVYTVQWRTTGGYFSAPAVNTTLAVHDPSSRAVTGTGSVLRAGVRGDFAIGVSYRRDGSLVGALTYIERRTGLPVVLISLNFSSMSVVGKTAILRGQGTVNGSGSYTIEATFTDNGEPGAGIDQFGLQVTGSPNRGLTFAPLTITSGNIQVR